MIEIVEALKIVSRETAMSATEKTELSCAVGRVLQEDIVADTDLPPFDRSQMDGFALVASGTKKAPLTLRLVGESAAGKGWPKELMHGEAVRIMTGAPVPEGADAVQKLELCSESTATFTKSGKHIIDQSVEISEAVEKGRFIVRKGSEIKKGQTIFKKGEIVTENMIATLAAFGYARVKVGKQPRVAILGTGSEIVEINKKPGRDKIRNSNSVMLDVFSRRIGATTTILPIAKDRISDLKSQISDAAGRSDILIITGGVSVGKYDHTKTALAELGAEIFFDKVCLKPGKPTVFARLGKTLVFGLPGNPVSAAVTFQLFVRKSILLFQGASQTDLLKGFAVLGADAKAAAERDTYLPATVEANERGQLIAHPLRWHGSSDLVGFSRANSLIYIRRGERLGKGNVAPIVYL